MQNIPIRNPPAWDPNRSAGSGYNLLHCPWAHELTQKNPKFKLNRNAYPLSGSFNPITSFRGVPVSQAATPTVKARKKKPRISFTQGNPVIHLRVRLR